MNLIIIYYLIEFIHQYMWHWNFYIAH